MTAYLLLSAAEADLDGIWDYSAQEWGPARANQYVAALRAACRGLADQNKRGRRCDDIRPDYWRLPVQQHFLYYRVLNDGAILVVRFLHQRMNAADHL